MYDFANSGFTTVVITALSVSYALVVLSAPLTGAYFVVGLILLAGVNVARGRRAALCAG